MTVAGTLIKISAKNLAQNVIMIIGALIVRVGTMGSLTAGKGKAGSDRGGPQMENLVEPLKLIKSKTS